MYGRDGMVYTLETVQTAGIPMVLLTNMNIDRKAGVNFNAGAALLLSFAAHSRAEVFIQPIVLSFWVNC